MNNDDNVSPLTNLWRISRPLALLFGVMLYALGTGVVDYLGYPINWTTFWIGLACVTFLQLSSYLLQAYYQPFLPGDQKGPIDDGNGGSNPNRNPGQLPRVLVLQSALVTMTVGAALTVLLLASGSIALPAFIFLGIALLMSFFYSVPPAQLVYSGYGELLQAILIANLVPYLAFLFQTGEMHRLLAMLTFPLTALYLAMLLANSLRGYGTDMRYDRKTLMVRLGWQRGMNFHNILILTAYLLIALAALLGLPWSLAWPGLLSLPIGLYAIWQMGQIARGFKPNWSTLTLTSVALFGVTVYLLNLAVWTQ